MKVALIVVAIGLIWNYLPYYYNNDKAVDFITSHAETKSKCSCAGYVMRGMCPLGLLPAYAYSKTLPQMGFQEISTKTTDLGKGIFLLFRRMTSTYLPTLLFTTGSSGCPILPKTIYYPPKHIWKTVNIRCSGQRMAGIGSMFGLCQKIGTDGFKL